MASEMRSADVEPVVLNDATVRLPLHRRPGLTFYRYVVSEAFRPSIFALLGLTVFFLTKDLLGFSDLVVNRGLSSHVVALIALYKAAPIVTLMFPFAVLLGCLVAIGRMGADREVLALEASGVSAARLVWPFVAFAGAMTVVSICLSVAVAPWTNRLLDAAYADISREKPWAQIQRGTVSRFGEWRLEAREVNARGDEMEGILLWMPDIGQTIFAQQGAIVSGSDGALEIALERGMVVLSPERGPQSFSFDRLTTRLPDSDSLLRDAKERLRGLRVWELAERAGEFVASEGNLLSIAELELHRRFALPFATLVFGVLAVPLFLLRTNFSRSSGGVMGMFCAITYYSLAQFSQGLAQSGTIGAMAAAWLPNGVLALVAFGLIVRARRAGVLGHAFDRPQSGALVVDTRSITRKLRPSRFPLPRYVAARFARMALMAFGILLVGYLLIDIMERLTWFSRYQATGLEVLRFYGARSVLLGSRVVPMALLVATALTVSMLAADGELIGMRACGIPAPRALMPILFIAALVVPADAILNNVIVPRTNALADELKRTEIKSAVYKQIDERRKASVWYRQGNRVLEAVRFDPNKGTAEGLSIYELGPDRLPISRTDAEFARHVGHGWWLLTEASRINILEDRVFEVPAPRFVDLGEALPAEVDTMHLSIPEIGVLIDQTAADGIDTRPLRVDFHIKLAQPLACIVLPAVVLFFAVTGPPFPGPAQTLLVSVLVGVGYFLIAGVSRSLGYGGAVPAIVGGWGPMMLFGGVAGLLGLRIWRRQ